MGSASGDGVSPCICAVWVEALDGTRALRTESAHRATHVASMAHVELPGNPLVSSHRVALDQSCKGLLTWIIATHRAEADQRFAKGTDSSL